MKAEIIAVGTELLLGQILNTNAQFLSVELSHLGIDVYFQTVVGDNPIRLKEALGAAFARSDAVFLTGGLGPTKDDLTKETTAEYFGLGLALHEETLNEMKEYFGKMHRLMSKNNEKQAFLPESCHVLKNTCGTAPGCIIEKDGKYAVMLPGPPAEMKVMFYSGVKPYFERFNDTHIYSRVLRFFGIGESVLEELLWDVMENAQNPTVAPYAKEGEVTVRVTAKCKTEVEAADLINPVADEIINRVGEFYYAEGDDETLASTAAKLLMEHGKTLAVCESCTGGMLAAAITDFAGISSSFLEGAVTYSNEAKIRLGVSADTIDTFGAVSEECAMEMASSIRKKAGTDYGISITGIAGPDGGNEEKPVGLVYIAADDGDEIFVRKLYFGGDRGRVRRITVMNALHIIIKLVNGEMSSD